GLLSYVLRGSHYHALVRIRHPALPIALHPLPPEYARGHNRRHSRRAHLFRAHAMTREIASDRQLVAACRYLALNPVAAGLVASPFDWPWSSARAHAGLEESRIPLCETDLRAVFGDSKDWRERYPGPVRNPDSPPPLPPPPP